MVFRRPEADVRAPRDDRGRHRRPDTLWSITCFFVPRQYRGLGVASRLIKAAVAHAKAHGAQTVEAYPVDPASPSYRFMGFVPAFERERFRETGRLGTRRHVYRRRLRA